MGKTDDVEAGIKRSEAISENSAEYFTGVVIHPTGFREYDVRWRMSNPVHVNYNGLTRVGQAFGTLAREAQPTNPCPPMVVGHDFRSYSQNVKNAFVVGLLSAGIDVIDIGLVVSPGLYFAQHHLGVPWGAMITASHNDNGWTGVKLAHGLSQTLGPNQIVTLRQLVDAGKFSTGAGKYRWVEKIREAYIEDLGRRARPQRPLRVVVGTGNGTAGWFTPDAFRRAGHEVIGVETHLDWNFPSFNPNPENVEFMHSIGAAVREHNADLGIGIDGDGDRVGVVDDRAREVFSDKAALLMARELLSERDGAKGTTFVVDVKSTNLFEMLLEPLGARIVWEKTGHSYIKAGVARENAVAGFERSGHFFFTPPLGRGYDDATLSGLIFAAMLSRQSIPLSEWLDQLPNSYQSPNMQPRCADEVKLRVVDQLRLNYEQDMREKRPIAGHYITRVVTINGIRAHFDDGSWFLVRASSNIPALVVLGESFTDRRRLHTMMEEVIDRLAKFPEVGEYDQKMPLLTD